MNLDKYTTPEYRRIAEDRQRVLDLAQRVLDGMRQSRVETGYRAMPSKQRAKREVRRGVHAFAPSSPLNPNPGQWTEIENCQCEYCKESE